MHLNTHHNLTTLHHSNFTQVTHSRTASHSYHSRSPYDMPGRVDRGSRGIPPTNLQPNTWSRWVVSKRVEPQGWSGCHRICIVI